MINMSIDTERCIHVERKDTEMADINLEREEQNRGPEARQAE